MMNIYAKEGDRVRCISLNEASMRWGSNDDPRGRLELGKVYTVDFTEVHSWHTKVYLKEFPDFKFSSAHFEDDDA